MKKEEIFTPRRKPPENDLTFDGLRQEIREKNDMALKMRQEKRPLATESEGSLGAHREEVDPLVQKAIFDLRKMGYAALPESSFYDNCQEIKFENDQEFKFKDYEWLKMFLNDYDTDIKVTPRSLKLIYTRPKSAEEITACWHLVTQNLEELKQPASPVMTDRAEEFRKKHTELK